MAIMISAHMFVGRVFPTNFCNFYAADWYKPAFRYDMEDDNRVSRLLPARRSQGLCYIQAGLLFYRYPTDVLWNQGEECMLVAVSSSTKCVVQPSPFFYV